MDEVINVVSPPLIKLDPLGQIFSSVIDGANVPAYMRQRSFDYILMVAVLVEQR